MANRGGQVPSAANIKDDAKMRVERAYNVAINGKESGIFAKWSLEMSSKPG
jgi:hypothetical protein